MVFALFTHLDGLLRSAVLNPDEGFLATQAEVLQAGGRLYQDVVDRKPPLVPWLYWAVFEVTGSDALFWVRLLALVAHLCTAALLASMARRRWGSPAAIAAGSLYLVASAGMVPADSQAANFEVFMVPFTVLAVWAAERGQPVRGGLAVGVAALAKQVGGATLLPVIFLAQRAKGRSGVAQAVVASAVPVAVVAVICGVHDFAFWVFNDSNGYLDPTGSWLISLRRGIVWTLIFAAANLGAMLLAPRAWARRSSNLDLWLWLLAAFLGVAAGLRFFGHYYLQLAPPVSLLGAGALAGAPRSVWLRTAGLAVASSIVFAVMAVTTRPAIVHPYNAVALYVDQHSRPDERIFVWGESPYLYWAADRLPATRFLSVGFLTGYSGGRAAVRIGEQYAVEGAWRDFTEDLAAHPPALILDASMGKVYAEAGFPTFSTWLHDHYRAVATLDSVIVYAPQDTA